MKLNLNKRFVICSLLILSLLVSSFLFKRFVSAASTFTFNTYNEMINSTKLSAGDVAITLGFYSANDGGGATYNIKNVTAAYNVDGIREIKLVKNQKLIAVLKLKNDYTYNVKQIGIRSFSISEDKGMGKGSTKRDATAAENLRIINKIIGRYTVRVHLFFPTGRYYFSGPMNVKSVSTVEFAGVSNNFGSVFNYSTGDVYSVLIFNGTNNANPAIDINSNVKTINISNIAMYGMIYKCQNGLRNGDCKDGKSEHIIYGNINSALIHGKGENTQVNITNSSIVQWGTGISNIKVNVKKTRFSYNDVAVRNIKNSSTVFDSSFNSNNYAFKFEGNVGNAKINFCRVEWSKYNGYYIKGDSTGAPYNIEIYNNEFDRSSNAAINIDYSSVKPSNIKVYYNVFRRSGFTGGSSTSLNTHLYVNGCKNCDFQYNYTKVQCANDSNGCGGNFPKYVSYFRNCENTIVKNNDLSGSSDTNANRVENSGNLTYSTLSRDNIVK